MKKSLTLLSTLLLAACSDSSSSKNSGPGAGAIIPIDIHNQQNYIPEGYYIAENSHSDMKALAVFHNAAQSGINGPVNGPINGPIVYWLTTSSCERNSHRNPHRNSNINSMGYLVLEQGGLQYSRSNYNNCHTQYSVHSTVNPGGHLRGNSEIYVTTVTNSRHHQGYQEEVRLIPVDQVRFQNVFRDQSEQANRVGTDTDSCRRVFGKSCTEAPIYENSTRIPVKCSVAAGSSSEKIDNSGYSDNRNFDYLQFTVIEDQRNNYSVKPMSESDINYLLTGKSEPSSNPFVGVFDRIVGSISQNKQLISSITVQAYGKNNVQVTLQRPGRGDENLNVNSLLGKGVMRNIKGVNQRGQIIEVAAFIKCERK